MSICKSTLDPRFKSVPVTFLSRILFFNTVFMFCGFVLVYSTNRDFLSPGRVFFSSNWTCAEQDEDIAVHRWHKITVHALHLKAPM